jgi:hypothetical protein
MIKIFHKLQKFDDYLKIYAWVPVCDDRNARIDNFLKKFKQNKYYFKKIKNRIVLKDFKKLKKNIFYKIYLCKVPLLANNQENM